MPRAAAAVAKSFHDERSRLHAWNRRSPGPGRPAGKYDAFSVTPSDDFRSIVRAWDDVGDAEDCCATSGGAIAKTPPPLKLRWATFACNMSEGWPASRSSFCGRVAHPLKLRWATFACNMSEGWWTAGGSNSRPPRCERGALPAELAAHVLDGDFRRTLAQIAIAVRQETPNSNTPLSGSAMRVGAQLRVHAAGCPRCRKYSTRMGRSETKTMPRATSVKLSRTIGTLPKAYPNSVQIPTQMIPPVML